MFKILLSISLLALELAAFAGPMVTAEKWLCSRGDLKRTVRLYAPSKGGAPCKVFYAKRTAEDPDDSEIEAKQNAGEVKPIYYSNFTGSFCVRKMGEFLENQQSHEWSCSKL